MKKTIMALALTRMTLAAGAQTKVVKLWDNQSAPHANYLTGPDKDE